MPRRRFTTDQIIQHLREVEVRLSQGKTVTEFNRPSFTLLTLETQARAIRTQSRARVVRLSVTVLLISQELAIRLAQDKQCNVDDISGAYPSMVGVWLSPDLC